MYVSVCVLAIVKAC